MPNTIPQKLGRPRTHIDIDDFNAVLAIIEEGNFASTAIKKYGLKKRTFYDWVKANDDKHLDAKKHGLFAQLVEAEKEGRVVMLKNAAEDLAKERPFTVVTIKTSEKLGSSREEKTIDNVARDVARFNALVKVNELIDGQKITIKNGDQPPTEGAEALYAKLRSVYGNGEK